MESMESMVTGNSRVVVASKLAFEMGWRRRATPATVQQQEARSLPLLEAGLGLLVKQLF